MSVIHYMLPVLLALPFAASGAARFPVSVAIVQGDREVPVVNHEVRLRREPFRFVFRMPATVAREVYLNLCRDDTHYRDSLAGRPLSALPATDWGGRGMAEGSYNIDNEMMISPESFNVWYYESETDHRFNEAVRLEDGSWRFHREIARIVDLHNDPRMTYSLADYPSDSLHIVFLYRQPVAGQPEYHPSVYRHMPLRIVFEPRTP